MLNEGKNRRVAGTKKAYTESPLSKRERNNNKIRVCYPPNENYYLGTYPILEQYGLKGGEVYIDANGIYKLMRHRFNKASAIHQLKKLLNSIQNAWNEPNHTTGVQTVTANAQLNGKWRIVIDIEGENANQITTIFDE